MKDSTKKWLTITGGLVICAILVFVIAQQFTKEKATDALPPTSSSQQDEVVVDPDIPLPILMPLLTSVRMISPSIPRPRPMTPAQMLETVQSQAERNKPSKQIPRCRRSLTRRH